MFKAPQRGDDRRRPNRRRPFVSQYGTFDERSEEDIDRDKLSALFEVSDQFDPTVHGPIYKDNQVTPQQFERILQQYTAIRSGQTAFQFEQQDTNLGTKAHKSGAMNDIGKLLQTSTGRELISALATGDVPVNITKAEDPMRAFEVEHEEIQGYQNARERQLEVNYQPGVDLLSRRGQQSIFPDGNEVKATSDAVLYHELVHAYHVATGSTTAGTLQQGDNLAIDRDRGVNKEEYATVGLGDYTGGRFTENKYRAQQRALQTDQDDRDKYAPRTSYRRFRR